MQSTIGIMMEKAIAISTRLYYSNSQANAAKLDEQDNRKIDLKVSEAMALSGCDLLPALENIIQLNNNGFFNSHASIVNWYLSAGEQQLEQDNLSEYIPKLEQLLATSQSSVLIHFLPHYLISLSWLRLTTNKANMKNRNNCWPLFSKNPQITRIFTPSRPTSCMLRYGELSIKAITTVH